MAGHRKVRARAVGVIAAGVVLSVASTAQAQRPPTLGAGAPSGQSGIQLYNFNGYLTNGAGEITCPAPPAAPTPYCVGPPAPSTSAARLERVFAFAQSVGIKHIELYGYPGNPFPGTNPATPLNVTGLTALRALGDRYGLHFSGRHGNLNEANWNNQIAASKIIGQDHIGESGFPNSPGSYNTLQSAIATAQLLNRLGKRSVEAGLGPAYFHNHQQEFNTRLVDNGQLKSAWEVIMDRTEARWVSAQIDIGWAVCGLNYLTAPTQDPAGAMAEVTRLINKYQTRIVSFHVKDMVNIRPTCGDADQRELGLGQIDFTPMLAAARNRVRYYLSERDPVTPGGPTNFNPFVNTANSARALKSDPAAVLYAYPPTFTSVAAGTAAAANQVPVVVTNDGDAPLTITNVTVAADALDGGNTTAGDFAVVSHNCFGAGGVGPLAPGATCTVNVGFKPTRTNYTSVARLQFTSNSDDAVERVLLAARSTGDYIQTVGGDVPATLNLAIPNQPGSFGTFQPLITKLYETAIAASVTSTAGDGTLTVTDTSATSPGYLVNGTFALPQALQVRARNLANPAAAYQPMSATPTTLVTYTGPVNQDQVTVGFAQQINSTDVLRTGNYSKVLTFTLSTTQP